MSLHAILWTIVGILVPLLVGAALSLIALSPPEFFYAKVCFIAAASVLFVMQVYWASTTSHGILGRLAVSVPILLLVGIGLPEALQWLNVRQNPQASAVHQPANEPENVVLHIEPENGIIWSTKPGQTVGMFNVELLNTGTAVDVLEITKRYFLAQRGLEVLIKRLPQITDPQNGLLAHAGSWTLSIDFRPYMSDIKEVSDNFKAGPSRAGVYIVCRCRRHVDGENFVASQAYGLFAYEGPDKELHGAAIFTEGSTMDTVPAQIRAQFLTLHEIIPFLSSPERWTSITKEISTDANGKMHIRQY
jgi:hypothetical protein